VAVPLSPVRATRHGGPRQRVELGGMEAEDVAMVDGDELVRHQREFLEAQLRRTEERLTDERVVVETCRQ